MTKEKEFMILFNELEQYLRVEYPNQNYSYNGFVSKLYQVRKYKNNPVIENKYNFDILYQAGQIRNIIAHNNDIIVPSDRFMEDFGKIVNKLCQPLMIEQIMTRFDDLKTAKIDDNVGDVIELLKKHGYNTIPIFEDGKLLGAFTEKTVYDYLTIYKNESISKTMKISDIIEAIDLNNVPRKYFEFIKRDASLYEAYELYEKNRKDLLLLFVTEHGSNAEKLLGIVALKDLENALID